MLLLEVLRPIGAGVPRAVGRPSAPRGELPSTEGRTAAIEDRARQYPGLRFGWAIAITCSSSCLRRNTTECGNWWVRARRYRRLGVHKGNESGMARRERRPHRHAGPGGSRAPLAWIRTRAPPRGVPRRLRPGTGSSRRVKFVDQAARTVAHSSPALPAASARALRRSSSSVHAASLSPSCAASKLATSSPSNARRSSSGSARTSARSLRAASVRATLAADLLDVSFRVRRSAGVRSRRSKHGERS